MAKRRPSQHPRGQIILYKNKPEVRLAEDTVWLPQKQMAMLLDTERSMITKHLRNIFNSGELKEKSNVQKMHIPGSDKPVAFYNLDAIISAGYPVNSLRGIRFRIWATNVLRKHQNALLPRFSSASFRKTASRTARTAGSVLTATLLLP